MQAQLATLAGSPAFPVLSRPDHTFKPRLSGFLVTQQGARRVTVLLDTGATHCFICARLAATLGLPPSAHPGPTSVTTAAPGGTQDLPAPVMAHLGLGDTFREALSVSPMYMDFGNDLIWAGTGSRAAICASFTWTAASASCRGLHSFR